MFVWAVKSPVVSIIFELATLVSIDAGAQGANLRAVLVLFLLGQTLPETLQFRKRNRLRCFFVQEFPNKDDIRFSHDPFSPLKALYKFIRLVTRLIVPLAVHRASATATHIVIVPAVIALDLLLIKECQNSPLHAPVPRPADRITIYCIASDQEIPLVLLSGYIKTK